MIDRQETLKIIFAAMHMLSLNPLNQAKAELLSNQKLSFTNLDKDSSSQHSHVDEKCDTISVLEATV